MVTEQVRLIGLGLGCVPHAWGLGVYSLLDYPKHIPIGPVYIQYSLKKKIVALFFIEV